MLEWKLMMMISTTRPLFTNELAHVKLISCEVEGKIRTPLGRPLRRNKKQYQGLKQEPPIVLLDNITRAHDKIDDSIFQIIAVTKYSAAFAVNYITTSSWCLILFTLESALDLYFV